jgi:hypothetical protein
MPLGIALLASACATNIHDKHDTIQPSKVRFGTFSHVAIAPLVVEQSEGDPGDERAVEHMKTALAACLASAFKDAAMTSADSKANPETLLVEPAIENLKKVNGAERFFVGPMAGSSAVLLRTRYRNGATNDVIAEPVFYAKASAWSGAWTIGVMDNVMLDRVVNQACDYARGNY